MCDTCAPTRSTHSYLPTYTLCPFPFQVSCFFSSNIWPRHNSIVISHPRIWLPGGMLLSKLSIHSTVQSSSASRTYVLNPFTSLVVFAFTSPLPRKANRFPYRYRML